MRDPKILMRAAFQKQAAKYAERHKGRRKRVKVEDTADVPLTGALAVDNSSVDAPAPDDLASDDLTADARATDGPEPVNGVPTPASLRSSPGTTMLDTAVSSRRSSAITETTVGPAGSSRRSSRAVDAVPVMNFLNTDNPQPPEWYKQTKLPKKRGNYAPTIDHLFGMIRGRDVVLSITSIENLSTIAEAVQKAFFVTFNNDQAAKTAIRTNRLLDNQHGLPRIFTNSADYPFWMVADAKELYTKWWHGIFDTGLYRGIVIGKPKNEKLEREKQANKLDTSYTGRRSGKFHGNGDLLNGQWWPHQLCTVRDGAHNSAQAGISGAVGEGAWSVILAGDPKYPDVDNGDTILYCGTEGNGKEGPTEATQRMLESVTLKLPVRVIRSERGKNPKYRPHAGYRYDGLYQAVGSELLDAGKAHHRFRLERLPGQDPIRFDGAGIRPNTAELAEFKRAKDEKKFLA